jgi:hypothetical protein
MRRSRRKTWSTRRAAALVLGLLSGGALPVWTFALAAAMRRTSQAISG